MTKFNYPLAKPYLDKKDIDGVIDVLNSGILGMGPKSKLFEEKMCKYTGAKYASTVSSGTAGLHLALKALNIREGEEVITTPFSFIASSNAILFEKAIPVFLDVDPIYFNIDVSKIEKAITKKTRAILVVHIFGRPAKIDEIQKIAKKYNLKVIEDACESLGTYYKNRHVGTLGDFGVIAFYPNKQITTGEGGIVITNNRDRKNLIDSLKNQGRGINMQWLKHSRLGYNYRMDDMSASLGSTQMDKFEWMNFEKARIAGYYNKYLEGTQNITTPPLSCKDGKYSWFVYVIQVPKNIRNNLIVELSERGIHSKPYLPSIHLQPFMKKKFGYKKGDFPICEKISAKTLALPFYIGLKEKDIVEITNTLKSLL